MKIVFQLEWTKGAKLQFKDPATLALFKKYTERMAKYTSVSVSGGILQGVSANSRNREILWVCERLQAGAKILSSEDIAIKLEKVLASGNSLRVIVGGADGVSAQRLAELKPELLWSFGKLTLPHELASVVAAEQIYRAFAILKNHPYHSGH